MDELYQEMEVIKERIERYEQKLKDMKNEYVKAKQKVLLLWTFERGVKLLSLSNSGEIKK